MDRTRKKFKTIDAEKTKEHIKLALTNIGGVVISYVLIYLILL